MEYIPKLLRCLFQAVFVGTVLEMNMETCKVLLWIVVMVHYFYVHHFLVGPLE
uniref:Uncharacterized protein n=1 Tax=Rhizophora mucronata TaxID=61149 RepID=A0A2P2JGT8_RHIMU